MKTALIASAVMLAALAGCATKAERVADKEDQLAAAGFNAVPANTADRRNELAMLPSNKFSMRNSNGKLIYLYPDPIVCGCLYIGGQQAYGQYKQMMFQQRLANEQQLTAMQYEDSRWNWGPWGPGWWY